jgi:hypothetical protein
MSLLVIVITFAQRHDRVLSERFDNGGNSVGWGRRLRRGVLPSEHGATHESHNCKAPHRH